MVLYPSPSNDGTLANDSTHSSNHTIHTYNHNNGNDGNNINDHSDNDDMDDNDDNGQEPLLGSQLESFPPLFVTRSNVLNSPAICAVEPLSSPPEPTPKDAHRWLILSLSCLLLFGNYFAYDNPAALNTQLQEYLGLPYNDYQYLLSTLYSVYSLPNTILPFLFGHLIDRFGPQRVLFGLSGCVCFGQAIFSFGVQERQIWMMLVGRAIFGVGGESCGVAQASMTTTHFRGHELAFALGLNLCIARFGSVVNTIVTPWAEQKWGVPTAVWIGTLSCFISFLSAVCLLILLTFKPGPSKEKDASKKESESTPLLPVQAASDMDSARYLTHTTNTTTAFEDDFSSSSSPTAQSPVILQHLPGMLRREASFSGSIHSIRFTPGYAKTGIRPSIHIITDQAAAQEQRQSRWWHQWWEDSQFFPLTFWLICALTVLLYGTVVPFNNIASDFLQSKWYPGNPRKAAAVMGIPDTIGAILVPAFGIVVDRYGGRASTLIASAFIMIVVHSTLAMTTLSPIFSFTLLGIAYSIVVTSELHLGKGYGISSSFLNISLTLVPLIVATIRVNSEDFQPVEMFFIGMGICGVLVGFALRHFDNLDGGALEHPEIQVEVPVIVSQASAVASSSTLTACSPVLSTRAQSFSPKRRERPQLGSLQNPNDAGWISPSPSASSFSIASPTTETDHPNSETKNQGSVVDRTRGGKPGKAGSSSFASPSIRGPSRRWAGKPLLQRTLTRVGSPLLQQYTASPRYGSFSSPSIMTMGTASERDVEEGIGGAHGGASAGGEILDGLGVTLHPILYNPLRGSSGSFRVNRNARPVAFGEGEEGRIYLDGQEVEPRGSHDDEQESSNNFENADDEYATSTSTSLDRNEQESDIDDDPNYTQRTEVSSSYKSRGESTLSKTKSK
ncbi:hypothetical protein BGZ94_010322 [Podila epigama]|nr:hypothetical protein BGZ94_010322 [Podila epigama]